VAAFVELLVQKTCGAYLLLDIFVAFPFVSRLVAWLIVTEIIDLVGNAAGDLPDFAPIIFKYFPPFLCW
jgi:hypothetical protein